MPLLTFCFHCCPVWRHLFQLPPTSNVLDVLADLLVYTVVSHLHEVAETRFVDGLAMPSDLPVSSFSPPRIGHGLRGVQCLRATATRAGV